MKRLATDSGKPESRFGCNYIESLLGIETQATRGYFFLTSKCCNYIESLLGIETPLQNPTTPKTTRCNYIESLLGIETSSMRMTCLPSTSCNYIESLLGIETKIADLKDCIRPLQLY